MRFVILHYHIFKNSGTTIEWMLYHNCGERFRTLDAQDRDHLVSNEELLRFLRDNPEVEAVSSHQMYDPVPCVPGFIFYDICFLRDPLDRIRSVYDYFREKPVAGDPISDLANSLALGDYVARLIADFPWTINDVQVNQLANGRINDQPNGPQDLERATERILNTSFLGVVDRFNESLIAGQHSLRAAFCFNQAQEPVNVSRGLDGTLAARIEKFKAACDERTYAELLRLNRMDIELLNRARAEVERRFRRVGNRAVRLPASVTPSARTPPVKPVAPSAFRKATRLVRAIPHLGLLWPRKNRANLFDAEYYRATNPDVAASGINALLHFIVSGAFDGRNPHRLFDASFYLREYPEVAAAGMNPLIHYLKTGGFEGRFPHPLFDSAFYLTRYEEVRESGINPLLHYVNNGAMERRKPHPYFEPHHYLRQNDFRLQIADALVHFLQSPQRKLANPHVLFDCESYLAENAEAAEQGINPLVHYLSSDPDERKLPHDASVPEIEIRDVKIQIVVRTGADGRTQFIAPSWQQAFFEGVSYDQLGAQIGELSTIREIHQPVALERIDGR